MSPPINPVRFNHVLESISGHLSRRMLEHYSHIRIDAKRQALDALDESRRDVHNVGGSGDADRATNGNDTEPPESSTDIPLLVALSESLTSQSRHSLRLAGSPPSAKLLIPLDRRDGRVAEGARLENEFGEPHRRTSKHSFVQSIQAFTSRQCASM